MDLFENDLILPGVITEIMPDYNYGYDTSQFGKTKSVTVIGTAFDGPVGKVVPVYSPEHAKYVFGPTYDPKTRREASLVANIQDTWDKGCRTIYAVRVSGKPIYKDFQFGIDTNLKLRVSGIFPSNGNKDVCMVFDNANRDLKIKIYKPAIRATIQEKMEGLVEKENSMLVTTIDLSTSYGIQKDTRLLDLLTTVNDNRSNNVIRLSIVDKNGVDVTSSSQEAQYLSVGDILPGLYLIGRDENRCVPTTQLDYVLTNGDNKPYGSFNQTIFKDLKLNTDVTLDLPIFGTIEQLNTKFTKCQVIMTNMFDILETPGQIDLLYAKDSTDYEEVDINGFDLYQKLGSGFAITAKAVAKDKEGKDIRIIETPTSDANRISPIKDGIYSMLENSRSDYRILTNGVADESIIGKIPKKEDFKSAIPTVEKLFDGKIEVKSNNDINDLTKPKNYKFEIKKLDTDALENVKTKISTSKTIKAIGSVKGIDIISELVLEKRKSKYKYANGTLILDTASEKATLYRFSKGYFEKVEDATVYGDLRGKCYFDGTDIRMGTIENNKITFNKCELLKDFMDDSKEYILIESDGIVSTYKVLTKDKSGVNTFAGLVPIGEVSRVLEKEEDKTLVTIQNEFEFNNIITINTSVSDYTTLYEFVELLNENKELNKLFSFDLSSNIGQAKDYYLEEIYSVLYPKYVEGAKYKAGEKVSNSQINYTASAEIKDTTFTAANWKTEIPIYETGKKYIIGNIVTNTSKLYVCIVNYESDSADFDKEKSFWNEYKLIEPVTTKEIANKSIRYNTSLYIPYKTTDTFDRHLAQHCTYTSLKTSPTHGVIGLSKLLDVNLNSIAKKVDKIINLKHKLSAKKPNGNDMLDKENMPYLIGRNISVVFGPQYIINTGDNYNFISNGASGYAGMVSKLPLDQSSTAQPINISTPMFELTNYQLERLTQAGFVTFKQSYTRGYVVTDGITMAEVTSPYRRLSVTRIINTIEDVIREAVEPFIGKQNHLTNQNSMQTAIKSRLEKLKGKLIEDYDFRLIISKADMRIGIINIDYNITPIYEIKEVRNRISIKDK